MKIAVVTYALQVGGVETFIKLLSRYLAKHRHEVIIFETSSEGRWSDVFREQGFTVWAILPRPLESRRRHALRIAEALREFDAIILNDAPFAQAILGLLDEKTVAVPVLHMTLTTMVRNACGNEQNWDAIACVCPAGRSAAIDWLANDERVMCIPNGVVVPVTWPKANEEFAVDSKLRLIYIGALNHSQKGILHLPEILREVIDSGCEVHVDVIGGGPDEVTLARELSQTNLLPFVTLHGALANEATLVLLNQAHVLLMPSYYEGLPIVLLEALAAGVVPIASNLAGCTDFAVDNGDSGILIAPGDESGFAEAVKNVCSDRLRLREMSRNAWQTAVARFSYSQLGVSYLDLLLRCREFRVGGNAKRRSGQVDTSLLGDLPDVPIPFVRPVRKALRLLGLFPPPTSEPLLYQFKQHP